jgi:hypothetical protein
MTWHVHPVNDLHDHNTESSICNCEPNAQILPSGDILIVHNSYDGREGMEIVNQILKLQDNGNTIDNEF